MKNKDEKTQVILIAQTPFTKREQEIVNLLAMGLTSNLIADKLCISAYTVANHRKNIFKKAECSNVVQLINKCLENGWV